MKHKAAGLSLASPCPHGGSTTAGAGGWGAGCGVCVGVCGGGWARGRFPGPGELRGLYLFSMMVPTTLFLARKGNSAGRGNGTRGPAVGGLGSRN